jgi:hypothetical protein
MNSPVLTRAENRQRIAAEGSKAARRKFEESRKAIEKAMRQIEKAVEENGGVYPCDGGRVTIAEVLHQAGRSEAYLRKTDQPSLIELRQRVQDFVDRANKLTAQGARSIRTNATDTAREAQAELKLVMGAYADAEREYSDARKQLEIAEKTIEELRAQNTMLQKKLDDEKVVELRPTRK